MIDAPEPTAGEVELKRRLGDLAALATIDTGGWDKLQDRLADVADAGSGGGQRVAFRSLPGMACRRPARTRLLVAAAVVVVLGAIVLMRNDTNGEVETVDDTTTTTGDGRSSTTSTTQGRSTTTSVPPGQDGLSPGTGTGAPGGTDPSGDGSTGPAEGTGSPGGAGVGTTPPTSSPATTAPAGVPPDVTFTTSDYTLVGWFRESSPGTFYMTVYRDGYGIYDWLGDNDPGHNCLAGRNITFPFPEQGLHAYSWGMVRADAAEVRVVTHTGEWTTAVLGSEAYPGVRPWIARRQTEQISHYEARDAAGNVLHTAAVGGRQSNPPDCQVG